MHTGTGSALTHHCEHRAHCVRARLLVAPWNSASRSVSGRQTQKRKYFTDLLVNNEVACIFEAWGAQEDLTQVPDAHRCYGPFLPPSSSGTSNAGGVVVAIHGELLDRASAVVKKMHARGRAMTMAMQSAVPLSTMPVHIDPALPMSSQCRRLMEGIVAHLRRTDGFSSWSESLSGDGSFRQERAHGLHLSRAHSGRSVKQTTLSGASGVKRWAEDSHASIVHSYTNMHPNWAEGVWAIAGVVRFLARRRASFEH